MQYQGIIVLILIRFLVKWHPNLHKTLGLCSIIFATLTFFHSTNFLEKKISLLKSKWLMKICIFRGTFIKFLFSFFISNFVFRRQPPEFLFSKKICKMRAAQNNKWYCDESFLQRLDNCLSNGRIEFNLGCFSLFSPLWIFPQQ